MTALIWHENRAFSHYHNWEDYQSGFYKSCRCKDKRKFQQSREMLLNPVRFAESAWKAFDVWPVTCAVNLTNTSINHKAWIGHAAAFVSHHACEKCTISAWHSLSSEEQLIANNVADLAVKEWVKKCVNANYQTQSTQLELTF